jgi:hypothetical protein
MKISPALIPHKEFHNGIWLRSSNGKGWYYFVKKKSSNTIANKKFMQSVDIPLRELVQLLHSKEIKTTPSCSGHCFKKPVLKDIYKSIESDGHLIRQGGIELKDVETGEKFFFSDEEYTLPWNKSEFVDHLGDYQQNGIIGIKPGKKYGLSKRLRELDLPHIEVAESGPVILLSTTGNGKNDNAAIWDKVTRELRKIVREEI